MLTAIEKSLIAAETFQDRWLPCQRQSLLCLGAHDRRSKRQFANLRRWHTPAPEADVATTAEVDPTACNSEFFNGAESGPTSAPCQLHELHEVGFTSVGNDGTLPAAPSCAGICRADERQAVIEMMTPVGTRKGAAVGAPPRERHDQLALQGPRSVAKAHVANLLRSHRPKRRNSWWLEAFGV